MRVAIVGSRSVTSPRVVANAVEASGFDVTTVVSGGARGVDSLAEAWAKKRGIKCVVYFPDWDKHGKRAGYLRNTQIVNDAQALIAIWDGESRGTKHSIDLALKRGIPTYIHDTRPARLSGSVQVRLTSHTTDR